MSVDPECSPELTAMLGSAIATAISDIPALRKHYFSYTVLPADMLYCEQQHPPSLLISTGFLTHIRKLLNSPQTSSYYLT